MARESLGFEQIVESEREVWRVETTGAGPQGSLPLTAEMLLEPVHDIRQIAQLAPRLLGERFVELFGRHAERELGGTMGE